MENVATGEEFERLGLVWVGCYNVGSTHHTEVEVATCGSPDNSLVDAAYETPVSPDSLEATVSTSNVSNAFVFMGHAPIHGSGGNY